MSLTGEFIYKYLHKPILSPIKEKGGIIGYIKVAIGKRQMQNSAITLKIPDFNHFNSNATIVGVAGKNNWYQMIFCLYSFFDNVRFNLKTVIIDDGSLDEELIQKIKIQVPFLTVITHLDAELEVKRKITADKYPVINSLLDKFVVFKKIFHARALIDGPVLVLDADMLFYRTPDELIEWINAPTKPIYMYDKFSIYGLKREELLKRLPIKRNVNTGVIGLDNDVFDFEKLEKLAKQYLQEDSLNYLIEQALYAMYLNGIETICLPADSYEILPSKKEAKKPMAIMHHYPSEYRKFYFRYAWRHVIN